MKNADRERLDAQRGQAAKFFVSHYSREKRYLIILSRDLQKGFEAIKSLGIEKAKEFQLYWDFQCDFERLMELRNEYRWDDESLTAQGINFRELNKLYSAVC